MGKKRYTEAELLKGLDEHTAHADELAGSLSKEEIGENDILKSIDEDMKALKKAGIKTEDWDHFKSR